MANSLLPVQSFQDLYFAVKLKIRLVHVLTNLSIVDLVQSKLKKKRKKTLVTKGATCLSGKSATQYLLGLNLDRSTYLKFDARIGTSLFLFTHTTLPTEMNFETAKIKHHVPKGMSAAASLLLSGIVLLYAIHSASVICSSLFLVRENIICFCNLLILPLRIRITRVLPQG